MKQRAFPLVEPSAQQGAQYSGLARVSSTQGFSLVELSIVLVILGLLVGGVLAGKSLIHAAELRSVSRDFEKYTTAINAFRDKYFGLPGDITNATSFWGAADGDDGTDSSGAACTTVVSTSTATCNGDGNAILASPSSYYENYRAWQHLANAGLVEGFYTGTQDTSGSFGNTYINPGVNVAKSRLGGGGFLIGGVGTGWAMGVKFGAAGSTGNNYNGWYIALVKPLTVTGAGAAAAPFTGVLTHEDAWNIDTKMDDGVANTGKVHTDIIKSAGASVAITDGTCATYDLTNTTNFCAMGYIFGQ